MCRDSVLSAVGADHDLPSYRGGALAVEPAEYAELRGQLATFDVVAPRLAVFFELVDRSLSDEPVGTEPEDTPAATEPFPPHLDRGRGTPPTLAALDDPPAEIAPTVESIRSFHALDGGLPSIYRCPAQLPGYLDPAWADLEPALRDDGFADGCAAARTAVESYVESLPYVPQVDPETLPGGIDDDAIAELRELFGEFNRGPVGTVVPAIHVFADTVGVAGERAFL